MTASPNSNQCSLSATAKAEGALGEELTTELVDQGALVEAAQRLHGFSGREIAKLFTSLQTHVLYASQRTEVMHHLPQSMLFEVVDQKVKEHDRTAEFQVSGYKYHNTEAKTSRSPYRGGAPAGAPCLS